MATSAVTNGGAAVVPTGAAGGEASDRSDGKDKGGGSGGSSGSGGSTVSNYAGLLAALSYSFFSISITLFNKATLSSYKCVARLLLVTSWWRQQGTAIATPQSNTQPHR